MRPTLKPRSACTLPRPRELESRTDYIKRVQTDKEIKASFVAASKEWERAKSCSMVSIRTLTDEFLLFGDPRK